MSSAVVVTASYDKQIRFWDAASGRTVRSFAFQDSQINALLLIQDMHALVVGGFGVLRVYDVSHIISPGSNPQPPVPQAGGGGGSGGQSQAPPLLSSFESQSSMNFTSLGYFPLRHPALGAGDGSHNSTDDDMDGSSSDNDTALAGTISMMLPSVLFPSAHKEVGVVLYATSEDGHIRFFDAKSPTALRLLKDIYTGAAITTSCLSPDRRYLLTGSQIGVVSVWHLPSIIASVSLERNGSNGTSGPKPPPGLSESDQRAFEAVVRDAKLFGSRPLQEIPFQDDYTAIRSIAIDPLARWAVVATNAGNVHFLRFSHDAHLLGTKSTAVSAQQGAGVAARASNPLSRVTFGLARHDGLGGTGDRSYQGNGGGDTGSLSHGGDGASSVLPLNTNASGTGGSQSPSSLANNGPREGVYRSALVVNELSNHARRTPASEASAPLPGDKVANDGIGTALLDSLEEQQAAVRNSVTDGSTGAAGATGGDAAADAAAGASHTAAAAASAPPKSALQEELEMESFYSFQAHYKYILKALISPDGEQLVTCSADYTIGRFVIPQVLREAPPTPPAGAAAVTESQQQRSSSTLAEKKSASQSPDQRDAKSEVSAGQESGKEDAEHGARASLPAATALKSTPLLDQSLSSEPIERDQTASPSFAGPLASSHGADNQLDEDAAAKSSNADGSEAAATPQVPTSALQSPDGKDAASSTHPADHDADGTHASGGGGSESTPKRQAAQAPISQQHYLFKPLKPLTGHTRWVWDCVFSDCCRFLFSCSSDAQVRMWNGITTDRPQSTTFVGHTKPVVAILLCYDRSKQ